MNVSRTQFYNWCKEDPAFNERVESSKESMIDYVESKLIERIQSGDTTAIIFFLKCRAKNRGYIEKVQNEIISKNDMVISFKPVTGIEII